MFAQLEFLCQLARDLKKLFSVIGKLGHIFRHFLKRQWYTKNCEARIDEKNQPQKSFMFENAYNRSCQ